VTATFTITQPNTLAITPSQSNISCNGASNGTAAVSVSGGTPGYSFSWSNGGTGVSENNLAPGNYTCLVTDTNGCTQTQSFSITEPPALSLSVSSADGTCGNSNGTATVTASGGTPGYTYSWSNGGTGTSQNNLPSGNYVCVVTDTNSCSDSVSVFIGNNGLPVITITSQANVSCNGGSNGNVTVSASGGSPGYNYSWSSGGTNTTENNLAAGTYTCTVTDSAGCVQTQTISITEPSAITIASSQTPVSCNGGTNGSATVTPAGGTPGYSYSWSSGGTNATENNLSAGTYTCTVTDANGCTQTQTFLVTDPTAMSIGITSSPACGTGNGNATANVSGGSGGYSYAWSPVGGTNSVAAGLPSGTYSCTVTDANGCTQTETVVVTTYAPPTAVVSADTTIYLGVAVVLTAAGGATYNWSPSTGLSCTTCQYPSANPDQTTTYCVFVSDTNGCSDTACVTVFVNTDCGELFVPNAFSPNDDGQNDQLCIYGSRCVKDLDFAIYDRWGEKIFETTDANSCWDGTYKGERMNNAVFVYYLHATLANGTPVSKKGNIALIR